jgi:hypothetical protein
MNRPDHDRSERELEALDRLLDAVPDPRPPAGLAERVLAATAAERAAAAGRSRSPAPGGARLLRLAGVGAALAAAAALLLWLGRPGWLGRSGADRPADAPTRVASADPRPAAEDAAPAAAPDAVPEAPPELLAELELLEEWELLVPDDLDLLLAELDELDELLLELPETDDAGGSEEEQG